MAAMALDFRILPRSARSEAPWSEWAEYPEPRFLNRDNNGGLRLAEPEDRCRQGHLIGGGAR
jgi:hypothetical protein